MTEVKVCIWRPKIYIKLVWQCVSVSPGLLWGNARWKQGNSWSNWYTAQNRVTMHCFATKMIIVVVVVLVEMRRKERRRRRRLKRNRSAQHHKGTVKILACGPAWVAIFFPPSLAVLQGQIQQTMNSLHQARRGCFGHKWDVCPTLWSMDATSQRSLVKEVILSKVLG